MKTFIFLVCLSVFAMPASADVIGPTTYYLNRTIEDGTVTGFIQTDGTIGTLATGNLIDWSLLLDDASGTFLLTGPLSGGNSERRVEGGAFSATATDLLFDFSNQTTSWVLLQKGTIGGAMSFWSLDGAFDGAAGYNSAEVVYVDHHEVEPRSGVQSIATVPEPSTLLLVAMAGLGLLLWRRSTSKLSP